MPLQPANDWERQAFAEVAALKAEIDHGRLDPEKLTSVDAEVLRREQRLMKALSIQRLMSKPVMLTSDDWKDKRAYALFQGTVWQSDLSAKDGGGDELVNRLTHARATGSAPRERIPTGVRRAVWARDRGACAKCGSRDKLEYDHIIPLARGGCNTERNVELLCEACNRAKSHKIE
jgi:hypothetical protein